MFTSLAGPELSYVYEKRDQVLMLATFVYAPLQQRAILKEINSSIIWARNYIGIATIEKLRSWGLLERVG